MGLILPARIERKQEDMQAPFKVISLSFKNAPVEVREVIALDEASIKSILQRISEVLNLQDALILSTCNRTEIYYTAERDLKKELISILGMAKGISEMSAYAGYFESLEGMDAVNYLFRVSMGLEAQVVGDMQISNQVKRAYQMTADAGLAGPFLHRLLHTIFFASKRVAQETAFRDGAASVSYASAELVNSLAENISDAKVLILGLGEIGREVAKHLADSPLTVGVCNRTQSKAEVLGAELGLTVVEFDQVDEAMGEYDVIISSIATEEPFITGERLSQHENKGYKFLLDLSMPRSIAPDVVEIPGAALYNIDEINLKTTKAVEKRIAAVPAVEAIIADSLVDFKDWARDMEVSPTIKKLKNALEEIRQEELAKHLKNATAEQEAFAEKLSKSITQKIMKMPVLQLKAACKRGDADTLIDVLSDLFDLEKQPAEKHEK